MALLRRCRLPCLVLSDGIKCYEVGVVRYLCLLVVSGIRKSKLAGGVKYCGASDMCLTKLLLYRSFEARFWMFLRG